jgi:DNA-binding transcriptional LysR family regulator
MNLNHLNYFYHVVCEGGFTKASLRLRIGQPAISRVIQELEGSLGVTLLERQKRSVSLTEDGRIIFDYCKKIFQEVDNLKSNAESLRQEPQGPLSFCTRDDIAAYLLPDVLQKLKQKFPLLWPMIQIGPFTQMIDRLKRNELEFGIFFYIPEIAEDIEIKRITEISHALVIATQYKKDRNVLTSFIGSRELDDRKTKHFPTLTALKKIYPEASIRLSCNSLASQKEFVRRGLGVAVLPRFVVEEELKSKEFSEVLPNADLNFPLHLVTKKGKVLSRGAKALLDALM